LLTVVGPWVCARRLTAGKLQLRFSNHLRPQRIRIGIENGAGVRRENEPRSQFHFFPYLIVRPSRIAKINVKNLRVGPGRIRDWLASNHEVVRRIFERSASSAEYIAAKAVRLFVIPILGFFILRDGRYVTDEIVEAFGRPGVGRKCGES
jgi:hypothetical protein